MPPLSSRGIFVSGKRYTLPDYNDKKYKGLSWKQCSDCGERYPVHHDFFQYTKRVKDGKVYRYLRGDCNICRSNARRADYAIKKNTSGE
jgi:hypothetical protein